MAGDHAKAGEQDEGAEPEGRRGVCLADIRYFILLLPLRCSTRYFLAMHDGKASAIRPRSRGFERCDNRLKRIRQPAHPSRAWLFGVDGSA
jgi:hypothetical protein